MKNLKPPYRVSVTRPAAEEKLSYNAGHLNKNIKRRRPKSQNKKEELKERERKKGKKWKHPKKEKRKGTDKNKENIENKNFRG